MHLYPKYRESKKKGIKSVVIDDESDSGSEDEPATTAPASPKKKRAAPPRPSGKIGKAKSQGRRKKSATKGDSENDLAADSRKEGRGSMMASIASKYGGCGGEGDIDDGAFAAAQAKVMEGARRNRRVRVGC